MNRKIVIIACSVVAAGIASYFVVRTVQKSAIKKRLDLAYNNPGGQDAAGGLNKLLASGVFDPTTYQKNGKATITLMEARDRSDAIWDAYSYFFESDQTAIVNAFNGLGHQADVSKISHEFKESHDNDLLEILQAALTDKAKMNLLVSKINSLPSA